jgi:Zn-dependent protease
MLFIGPRFGHSREVASVAIPAGRRSPWRAIAGTLPLLAVGAYWSKPAPVVAHVLLACVFYVFGLVFHEFGHAAVATLLRMRVGAIFIGMGPAVGAFRVAGVPVVVQAVPISAITQVFPRDRRLVRLRFAAVFVAGPLANALLVAIGLLLLRSLQADPVMAHEVATFVAVNAFMVLTNLIPLASTTRAPGRGLGTDGYRILTAHRISDATIGRIIAIAATLDASELIRTGRAMEAVSLLDPLLRAKKIHPFAYLALGDAYVKLRRYPDALNAYASFPIRKAPAQKPFVDNAMAWCLIRGHGRSELARASRLSRRALKTHPDHANFLHTRAAVLIARGRLKAAARIIEALPQKQPKLAPGILECTRAELALARGDLQAAERELAIAEKLPANEIRAETAAKIRDARTRVVRTIVVADEYA